MVGRRTARGRRAGSRGRCSGHRLASRRCRPRRRDVRRPRPVAGDGARLPLPQSAGVAARDALPARISGAPRGHLVGHAGVPGQCRRVQDDERDPSRPRRGARGALCPKAGAGGWLGFGPRGSDGRQHSHSDRWRSGALRAVLLRDTRCAPTRARVAGRSAVDCAPRVAARRRHRSLRSRAHERDRSSSGHGPRARRAAAVARRGVGCGGGNGLSPAVAIMDGGPDGSAAAATARELRELYELVDPRLGADGRSDGA